MKRILSLFLTFSLLLGIIGCGAQHPVKNDFQGETVTNTAPQPPEEPSVEAEAPPPAEEEPEKPELPPEEPVEEPEEEPYVRVIDPAKPMVALTFDDGPHETYTGLLLDIFEENHSLATFFEQGVFVRKYPDVVKRMAEMGCEVASHTYNHKDLSTLTRTAMLQELERADQAFIDAIGTAPYLLRPPYGAVNSNVKNLSGRAVITWTVDTQDWLSQDADTIVSYVQSLENLDGEVVLLHSTHQSTVDAVAVLVPWLIEQGYQLVTVSELMAYYYGVHLSVNTFYGYTFFTTHGRTDEPLELPETPPAIHIPAVEDPPVTPPAPPAETPEAPPETPTETPEAPPEAPSETPETSPEAPSETPETPPEAPSETPPESPVTPPNQDPPPSEEPVLPPEEEGTVPPVQ